MNENRNGKLPVLPPPGFACCALNGASGFAVGGVGAGEMPAYPPIDYPGNSEYSDCRQHQHHIQKLDHRNLGYSISDF